MTELFNSFFDGVNKILGAGGVFLIVAALLLCAFTVCAVLLKWFEVNRVGVRVKFLLVAMGLCIVQWAISMLCNHGAEFVLLQVGISVLAFVPIASIKKSTKSDQNNKEFIELIDKSIKEECEVRADEVLKKQDRFQNFDTDTAENIESSASNVKASKCEIDFSHVKSVISRLEYLPLALNDRRQVKDLENTVLKAEAGEYTPQTKVRINDGLGALLKIMSKYGV